MHMYIQIFKAVSWFLWTCAYWTNHLYTNLHNIQLNGYQGVPPQFFIFFVVFPGHIPYIYINIPLYIGKSRFTNQDIVTLSNQENVPEKIRFLVAGSSHRVFEYAHLGSHLRVPKLSKMDAWTIINKLVYTPFSLQKKSRFFKHKDSPFKRRNSLTIHKHVLPAFVFEALRLRHMKCQYVSRVNRNL